MSAMACLLALLSCSDDSGNKGGFEPTEVEAKVGQANTQLENILYDLVNGEDPEKPGDIDLTGAYDLYMEALSMDGNHAGANFGAGILEVVMLTQDPQIQDFFDRVDAFIDAGNYFEAEPGASTFDGSLAITGPAFSMDQVRIPLAIPAKMTRAFCLAPSNTDPTIDELQGICLNEVLPRVATSAQRLTKVTAKRDFIFTVTPKMQGDMGEDPVELDLTEVYATLTGLSAVRAGLLHFTAYDFNFDAYTGEEMLAALTPGSSFGSLHSEGESRMQSALSSWQDAVDHLESAVDFLEAEQDHQGDDLIRIDPYDDLTQADLDSIKAYIPKARNILNSSDWISLNWDDKSWTPDEKVVFSLNSFYSSPVQDLKTLVPPYTPSLETIPTDTRWVFRDTTLHAVVTVEAGGHYFWQRSVHYEQGELVSSYANKDFEVSEWDEVFDMYEAMVAEKYSGEVSAYLYNLLDPGPNNVTIDIYYSYSEVLQSRYSPIITWEADSFEEWIFPDPTFGGLLPGMTDGRLKQVFGIDGDGWEKVNEMNLWDW
jgi:hypothetical protein